MGSDQSSLTPLIAILLFDIAEAVFISMLFRLVGYMNCLCYYKAMKARCILTFKAGFFYYLTIWIS